MTLYEKIKNYISSSKDNFNVKLVPANSYGNFVGENGNIKLEDADWNDGLDMAHNKGESVPFSAAYAENLSLLAKYMLKLDEQKTSTNISLQLFFRIYELKITCSLSFIFSA